MGEGSKESALPLSCRPQPCVIPLLGCRVASLQFPGGCPSGLCGWGGRRGNLCRSASGRGRDGSWEPDATCLPLSPGDWCPPARPDYPWKTDLSDPWGPAAAWSRAGATQGPRARSTLLHEPAPHAPGLPCQSSSVPLPHLRPPSGLGRPSVHTSCLLYSAHAGPSHGGPGLGLASEQEGSGPSPPRSGSERLASPLARASTSCGQTDMIRHGDRRTEWGSMWPGA